MRKPSAIKADAEQFHETLESLKKTLETCDEALDNLPNSNNEIFHGGDLQDAGEELRDEAISASSDLEDLAEELSNDLHFSREAETAGGHLYEASLALGHIADHGNSLIEYGDRLKNNPSSASTTKDASQAVADVRESLELAETQLTNALGAIPSDAKSQDDFEEHQLEREQRMAEDIDDYR